MLETLRQAHRSVAWMSSAVLVVVTCLSGCASQPPARQTGFLSDYSQLKTVDQTRSRYVSPRLREYSKFMVDPVEVRLPPGKLSLAERAEAAAYYREAIIRVLESQNQTVTDAAGVGVARVQVALTDIASSNWWQKVHPLSRSLGAGTGGAAMEGEIIDSITGEQLGAVVQSATGNQFDFTAFSTMADIKSAIDKWAAQAADRLREMKQASGT